MSVSCFAQCVLVKSSWKDVPAFVPGLERCFQAVTAMTNSGINRAGLAPDPNLIVSQIAQSQHKGAIGQLIKAAISLRVLGLACGFWC